MNRGSRSRELRSDTAASPVNLRRIAGFLTPYWRRFILILIAVAVSAVLGLIPPLLVRSILVSQRIMYDLKVRMYRLLHSLSLRFFTDHRTGEMMSRLTSDISGIDTVISGTLVTIASNMFILTSTLIIMLALSWQFTLLSLSLLPWLILPTLTVGRLRRRLRTNRQQQNAAVNAQMAENLSISGVLLVKTFNRERTVLNRFDHDTHQLMDLQVREALVGRWYFMLLALVTTAGPALIYWSGGLQVIREVGLEGGMTVGTVIAFVLLMGRLYGPATDLMSLHVDVMTSLAYFERIFDYLDLTPDIADALGAVVMPPLQGRVRFEHVSLEYVPGIRAVDDVTVEVEPGQLVALVGPSGGGKTSMTYLIPRLYDATSGTVWLDGHDIRGVTLESLRRQIGVVTQETFLFNTTVAENLRFAKENATLEEMEAACRAAYIADVINALPDRYDTIVGERGYRLSVGEKQRLAIARIVLKDPRIFLLDEATASLDSHSERAVQTALEPLIRGRTSIVIAHRLSTILAADVILYISHGQVLEQGSHAELFAKGEHYARLYEEQFKQTKMVIN
jgi:ATP-binding cassette subfamily B protein